MFRLAYSAQYKWWWWRMCMWRRMLMTSFAYAHIENWMSSERPESKIESDVNNVKKNMYKCNWFSWFAFNATIDMQKRNKNCSALVVGQVSILLRLKCREVQMNATRRNQLLTSYWVWTRLGWLTTFVILRCFTLRWTWTWLITNLCLKNERINFVACKNVSPVHVCSVICVIQRKHISFNLHTIIYDLFSQKWVNSWYLIKIWLHPHTVYCWVFSLKRRTRLKIIRVAMNDGVIVHVICDGLWTFCALLLFYCSQKVYTFRMSSRYLRWRVHFIVNIADV